MNRELQPPIFVVIEDSDVELYPTVEAAILGLEGVDVADGLYRLFDAQGRRIIVRAEGVRRSRWAIDIGAVRFENAESIPTGAEELWTALSEFLLAAGIPCGPNTELATLVRLVRERRLL